MRRESLEEHDCDVLLLTKNLVYNFYPHKSYFVLNGRHFPKRPLLLWFIRFLKILRSSLNLNLVFGDALRNLTKQIIDVPVVFKSVDIGFLHTLKLKTSHQISQRERERERERRD